ncbi:serine/threonine-protein kinase minibrain-like [Palaemon carinicauda]|uniref:serine/threonine-protein kinase minibrain-like n=1 Tax=Palaemon carinicauda TaxID=392227 RepID=UPI0035B68D3A
MSTAIDSRGNACQGGFQRWVKLPTDDLPLIRPPKHHMLAHITGGLTKLYDLIKENKKDTVETSEEEKSKNENSESSVSDENKNGPTDNGLCNNEGSDNGSSENNDSAQNSKQKDTEKSSDDEQEKNSQNEKKDDEGGGDNKSKTEKAKTNDTDMMLDDEEEETTPYTDEEGEFSPEKGMPYLAGRYKYTNVLARGQSAIIIKVLDTFHNDRPLAIKVLHRVYKPIGSQEADILLELHRADPWLHVPFARLLNQFLYGPHYCLVFEFLSPTPLYNHYDQRNIREASALPHIRDLTVKLLTVLGFLYKQNVIHADLKPENILLCKEDDLSSIMVVDFGNALRNTDEELSLYYSDFELQTLFYRAPEVIFGMKFSLEVDMWSLGCLLAECYLGEPLFMGKSKKEILNKITALMGPFPKEFSEGEYSKEFADFVGRPMSRYQRLENLRKRLHDCKDSTFLMLVERLLTYLPDRRFTPFEAACHPFVACSTPFLYLTPSPGYIRYPTILLDMSTYPYLPGLPDDEDENSASALSRKRLASFARFKRPTPSQASSQGQKEKESAPSTGNGGASGAVGAGTGTGTGSGGVGGGGGGPPTNPPVAAKKDSTDAQKAAITKAASNMVGPEGKTATRSDVKETLKSMGLRCEDFTISVYSREQAHAILRRQGVEVTPNNLQSREKLAAMAAKGGYKNARQGDMQRMPHNIRTVPPTNTWPMNTRPPNIRPQNIRKTVPRYEDDDDDCVILDPPDMPKPPPSVTLPQQFQLMGTTVQVNRGAKRPNRPMMNQPQAKRQNARPMQYYHKEHEEYGAEASVQDTLKRLKNYNISITCRRNASGLGPRGPMDGYSDMDDDSHLDSDEEEEDMTKYLECQIGEIDDMPEQEIFDEEIDPDDKDDVDYNPRGNKKRRNKSPRKGRRISSGSIRNPASVPPMEASLLDSSLEMIETDDNNDYIEREERNDEEFSPKQPSNEDREESESPMKSPEQSEEDKEDKDLDGGDEAHGDNDEEEQPERQEDVDEANSEHEQENEDVSKDDEVENEMDGDAEDPLACETKDDNNSDNVEEMISKEMEEENPAHDGPEDEEIDDELEKELLAGDVGEGEMEEEL